MAFFALDSDSGKQPSVSLSQECSSLTSSSIEGNGKEDTESHGSMIPGPRSCAVSIASSIENLNMHNADNHSLVASTSLTGVSPPKCDGEQVPIKTSSESSPSLRKVVPVKASCSDASVEEEKQNSKV